MLLLSRVLSPRAKQEPESALEVIILIELGHEGHYFASFHHRLIKLFFCGSRLSDQKLLLLLKFNIVAVLDEGHVAHLVFHLCDGLLLVIYVALCFPVCENCKHVFSVLLEPVFYSSHHDSLSMFLASQPFSPSLEVL